MPRPRPTDDADGKPPRVLAPPPAPPPVDRIRHLVGAHAPVLALHPDDRYLPCSGAWFAERATLLEDGAVVARRAGLATALARQTALGAAAARTLRLDLDPSARTGVPVADLPSVPIYVRAQMVVGPCRATLELAYIALYAHNGPYHPLGAIGPAVGAHDGDWERLTLRVDAESGDLLGVWYNSHRPRDGDWCAPAAAPRAPCGRVVAYVARHGHGTYATPGTIPRAFGFANDHTSAAGPLWRPQTAVLMRVHAPEAPHATLGRVPCRGCEVDTGARGVPPPEAAPEVTVTEDTDGVGDFAGEWGTVLAPRCQGWWAKAECPASRGTALRLFCQPWPEPE